MGWYQLVWIYLSTVGRLHHARAHVRGPGPGPYLIPARPAPGCGGDREPVPVDTHPTAQDHPLGLVLILSLTSAN